jgi:hypothetical protein
MCGGDSGNKWRHNMAHTRCMLDKQGYTHAHADAFGHPHVRTQARARAHKQICNYCFSTAVMIRERAWMLRYMYNAYRVRIFPTSG